MQLTSLLPQSGIAAEVSPGPATGIGGDGLPVATTAQGAVDFAQFLPAPTLASAAPASAPANPRQSPDGVFLPACWLGSPSPVVMNGPGPTPDDPATADRLTTVSALTDEPAVLPDLAPRRSGRRDATLVPPQPDDESWISAAAVWGLNPVLEVPEPEAEGETPLSGGTDAPSASFIGRSAPDGPSADGPELNAAAPGARAMDDGNAFSVAAPGIGSLVTRSGALAVGPTVRSALADMPVRPNDGSDAAPAMQPAAVVNPPVQNEVLPPGRAPVDFRRLAPPPGPGVAAPESGKEILFQSGVPRSSPAPAGRLSPEIPVVGTSAHRIAGDVDPAVIAPPVDGDSWAAPLPLGVSGPAGIVRLGQDGRESGFTAGARVSLDPAVRLDPAGPIVSVPGADSAPGDSTPFNRGATAPLSGVSAPVAEVRPADVDVVRAVESPSVVVADPVRAPVGLAESARRPAVTPTAADSSSSNSVPPAATETVATMPTLPAADGEKDFSRAPAPHVEKTAGPAAVDRSEVAVAAAPGETGRVYQEDGDESLKPENRLAANRTAAVQPAARSGSALTGRAANLAAVYAENLPRAVSDAKGSARSFLSSWREQVMADEPALGTGVANSTPAMPASTFPHPTPPDLGEHAALLAATTPAGEAPRPAVVVSPAVGASAAQRAVSAVLDAVDRFAAGSAQAVNLRLSVAGSELAVRVELRGGEVHATFRTDSTELRTALAQEWQAVSGSEAGRPLRAIDPVFAPAKSAGFDAAAGDNAPSQQRDPEARQSGEPAARRFPAPPAPSALAASAPAVSAPRSRPLATALRLHTFA